MEAKQTTAKTTTAQSTTGIKRTLNLTSLTVNAMALIAPGAFLWTTFQLQAAQMNGQVGTTINTPPSGNTCSASVTGELANSTGMTLPPNNSVYGDCFGTSGSNINYVVPANTTRVLSLKADIQSGANFSTVTAALLGDIGNLQGLTSSQSGSSSGATGSALSLTQSLLGVSQNNGLASPVSVTANSSHVMIGSYNLQASSASGVQVNTLSVLIGGSSSDLPILPECRSLGEWCAVRYDAGRRDKRADGFVLRRAVYGSCRTERERQHLCGRSVKWKFPA